MTFASRFWGGPGERPRRRAAPASTRRLMSVNVGTAAEMAATLLADMPRRHRHVSSVAAAASEACRRLHLEPEVVVSAAWLHDIGYAPAVAETGFHALDGARYLRRQGIDERVVNLVAHHSHALLEAELRGVERNLLDGFPLDRSLPHAELCFCDMTTGPDGQRVTVHERIMEIRQRYGPDNLVTRFIERAEPTIVATVQSVEAQLAAATQSR